MSLEKIALLKVSTEYKRDESLMTSSYIQDPTTVPVPNTIHSKYYVNRFCFIIPVFLLYHITAYQQELHTAIFFFYWPPKIGFPTSNPLPKQISMS